MKMMVVSILTLSLISAFPTFRAEAEELQTFRSPMDKVNYGIGVETIRNFRNQGVEIDLELVIKGMKDGLSGNLLVPEKELRAVMTAFQTELRQMKTKIRPELSPKQ